VLQVSNANTFVAERLSWFLGCQLEKAVDELNLSKNIISCHPSSLPLPDHVDCFVALNRSPSRLEFSEALLGIHSTFDGSMILSERVVQLLHRSVSTAVAQRSFLLTVGDRGAVNRRQVSVDHSRLGMGSIAERLAKQPLHERFDNTAEMVRRDQHVQRHREHRHLFPRLSCDVSHARQLTPPAPHLLISIFPRLPSFVTGSLAPRPARPLATSGF